MGFLGLLLAPNLAGAADLSVLAPAGPAARGIATLWWWMFWGAAAIFAGVMALFLLALAGIPLTAGFTGKFAVFRAAIEQGAWPLVLVAVLASAVAAFFYLRVIVLMYFTESVDGASDNVAVVSTSAMTTVAITFGAALTLVLGVWPSQLLQLANDASQFIR